MKTTINSLLLFPFVLFLLSISWVALGDNNRDFLGCLTQNSSSISKVIYTQNNPSYLSVLQFSIRNLRFATSDTPKPFAIVTPLQESEIQAVLFCAKKHKIQIRLRSGGHDVEGLSFVSEVPFVVLDLKNLRSVDVDVKTATAWVQGGATLGEVYYGIANKSRTLAFPAGVCPTVGVGGHISGGGYGYLLRNYGLAADNVIDVSFVDVNGRILDRKSMGEDLFWAIRGGGGASFGIILAWRIKLVVVPQTVTVFTVHRTLEQNATELYHKWQSVAPKLPKDLFLRLHIRRVNAGEDGRRLTIQTKFMSMFLGGVDRLLELMQGSFPELGLRRQDCIKMSWIESILYIGGYPSGQSPDVLLDRPPFKHVYCKTKSDFVEEPIPYHGIKGIWNFFYENEGRFAEFVLSPYGGKMAEISEDAIPFPHRAGNLYEIQHLMCWHEGGYRRSERHLSWIRKLYSYMTPFVSKSPRAAYLNYRDLDLGVNNVTGNTSYAQASIWGVQYFKKNFNKLVHVKTMVDPDNFFKNEQSIPPITT